MTELSPEQVVEKLRMRSDGAAQLATGKGFHYSLEGLMIDAADTLEAALQREAKLREALERMVQGSASRCNSDHADYHPNCTDCDSRSDARAALSDQPTGTGEGQ